MKHKTITIHQGTGDDAMEMTVQVTRKELDKMEEILSVNPSAWEGRELELVKAAKEAIANKPSKRSSCHKKQINWKLIIGLLLCALVIIVCVVFITNSKKKGEDATRSQETIYVGPVEKWIKNECIIVNRNWLYEALKEKNRSNVPESFNVFNKAMDSQSYREWAFEEALHHNLPVGTKEEFELGMTHPDSDVYSCIYEIASYYGMPDEREDMVNYLKESEANRKKFFERLLEYGMPADFNEFNNLLVHPKNNQQHQPNEYIHYLWQLSSRNGYKRDENYLKDELIKSVEYRKLFYDKLKAEEPNFIEKYSDFEKHWLYNVLSEPVYSLNLGTPTEFDSLVTNSEESRRWLWDKANEYGLNVGKDYDEFWSLIAPESYYYDHIGKLYLDAKDWGIKCDETQFRDYLSESADNRKKLFNDLKSRGMQANEWEYLKYIGYEEDLLVALDWQSVLNDFMATKEAKPNLTNEEWFEKFPEFRNDERMLQAAYDYDATVKSGKYSDQNELRSKFPEFWPELSKTPY